MENKINLDFEKQSTNAFIGLFEEKLGALDKKIKFSNDQLQKVDFEIQKFYTEEDIYAGKMEITIQQKTSDELIDRKLLRYDIIIGLISEKYSILKERIKSGYYTEELELVNRKLDLLNLQVEIIAKNEFVSHFKTRKNVAK
jgi:hypothetical protein